MQLFIVALTKGEHVAMVLKKFAENNHHGSVLSTKSIRHAMMDSIEPLPYFGGLSKITEHEEIARPMIFVVVKDDEEVKKLSNLVHEALGNIKGKGIMYSLPINYLEGLDD